MADWGQRKVDRSDCICHSQRDEYGKASFQGRGMKIHRAVWLRTGREIPEGMQLDHLCMNPRCINVDHLDVVTPRENTQRGKLQKLSRKDVSYVLDVSMMEDVRLLLHGGTMRRKGWARALAIKLGVTPETIHNTVKNNKRTWRLG